MLYQLHVRTRDEINKRCTMRDCTDAQVFDAMVKSIAEATKCTPDEATATFDRGKIGSALPHLTAVELRIEVLRAFWYHTASSSSYDPFWIEEAK